MGVAVCTADGKRGAATLVSDGGGGAIITWFESRSFSFHGIYAQRVSGAGIPQWPADGVAVCAGPGVGGVPAIASDGAGGTIAAWADLRAGHDRWERPRGDIYAQRVTSEGFAVAPPAPARIVASAQSLAVALAPALTPRAIAATKSIRLWNRGGSPWTFTTYIDYDWCCLAETPSGQVADRDDVALDGRGPTMPKKAPGHAAALAAGFGLAVQPRTGTIAAGDSLDLLVHLDAARSHDGDYALAAAVAGRNKCEPFMYVPCRLHVGLLKLKLDVKPDWLRVGRDPGGRVVERDDDEQARAERDGQVRAWLYLPPGVDRHLLVPGSVRLQRVLAPLEAKDDLESGDEQDDASSITVAESMRGWEEERDGKRDKPRSRRVRFRFDRAALLALLPPSGKAAVELSGELEGISWFAGVDWVEVVEHPDGTAADPVGAPPLGARPERDGLRLLTRNPVSGAARLELSLAAPAAVRVRVHDVGGALVRELARGDWDAGNHTLIWDGRTASGTAVPSGIYFVWLGGARVAQRIVLTR